MVTHSNHRSTLDVGGHTLTEGDIVQDTQAATVKVFRGVVTETNDLGLETEMVCWETCETRRSEHADCEHERVSSVERYFSKYDRYRAAGDLSLPIPADHSTVGEWYLDRIDGKEVATWKLDVGSMRYSLNVGKGRFCTTRADYGVSLRRPKLSEEGATSTREECIFRAQTFEQALAGAVNFMNEVSIDEAGDDDHAFGFFRMGEITQEFGPGDLEEGDVVKFHLMVKELNVAGGEKVGEHHGADQYTGEVIDSGEETVHVARYNGFTSSTAVVDYDQIDSQLV